MIASANGAIRTLAADPASAEWVTVMVPVNAVFAALGARNDARIARPLEVGRA